MILVSECFSLSKFSTVSLILYFPESFISAEQPDDEIKVENITPDMTSFDEESLGDEDPIFLEEPVF